MDDDQPPVHSREAMLYDWFKHLTTVSLITLGGVLSLSQSPQAEVKTSSLVVVVLFVGAAGVVAFTAAEQLMRAVANHEPVPASVRWLQAGAPALLGIGVGAFLYGFLTALN